MPCPQLSLALIAKLCIHTLTRPDFQTLLMEFVKKQLYRYELLTGLYMLDWWEKLVFNACALGVTAATTYYSYGYLKENGYIGV